MNFLFKQRKMSNVSCHFLHRALQNQNFWHTFPDSLHQLYLYPDPNKGRQNEPLPDHRSTMCITRFRKRSQEIYDFFLLLLHYLYSQPDSRTSCITIYLLSNIALYPSIGRTGSITGHVLQVMTNLLECLKHKFLFVFEVHVYLHGSWSHIDSGFHKTNCIRFSLPDVEKQPPFTCED